MEKGQFDRTLWVKKDVTKLQKLIVGKTVGFESKYTIAYRCPNCKKIELYTEDVKEDSK
jgi:hypothetical protein